MPLAVAIASTVPPQPPLPNPAHLLKLSRAGILQLRYDLAVSQLQGLQVAALHLPLAGELGASLLCLLQGRLERWAVT